MINLINVLYYNDPSKLLFIETTKLLFIETTKDYYANECLTTRNPKKLFREDSDLPVYLYTLENIVLRVDCGDWEPLGFDRSILYA